jgi:Crp-like helix-turn-helix domain
MYLEKNIPVEAMSNIEARTRTLRKGEIVEGSWQGKIYLINKGFVEISKPNNSIGDYACDSQIVELVLPGREIKVLSPKAEITWYDTVEIKASLPRLRGLLDFERLTKIQRCEEMINVLNISENKEKIFQLLTHLIKNYKDIWEFNKVIDSLNTSVYLVDGTKVNVESELLKGFDVIPLPLTHEKLSNTIAITRVTVTRLLKELREEGLVQNLNEGSQYGSIFAVKKPEIEMVSR